MKPRVLVVDDEDAVRRVICRALSSFGAYDVVTAGDGAQALAAAREKAPDLVLLDLAMPGSDGWETLRTLRAAPETRAVPVILVSGESSEESRVGGLGEGADDFIVKPFSPAELAARVGRLLERRRRDLGAQPLTGLPGNGAIEEEVSRRLAADGSLALLYADIDQFKAYNDRYGFAKGDEALRAAAKLLVDSAQAAAGPVFVGHVGGDDFALVCAPEDAALVAQRAALLFDQRMPALYSPEDRARGYFTAKDRQGRRRRVRLMTLSVGVATTERGAFTCYAQAAEAAGQMKGYLKGRPSRGLSRFAFDRRSR